MAEDMSSSGAVVEQLHTCQFLFKMKILPFFFYIFETIFEMHLHPTGIRWSMQLSHENISYRVIYLLKTK